MTFTLMKNSFLFCEEVGQLQSTSVRAIFSFTGAHKNDFVHNGLGYLIFYTTIVL